MAVIQEIDALIAETRSDPNYDPALLLSRARERLKVACNVNGEWDAADRTRSRGAVEGYSRVYHFLAGSGYVRAAMELLIGWWNEIGERQLREREHIYRAFSSLWLTQLFHQQGDIGAALRWDLLTQADELLGEHGADGGAGRHWLQTVFGVSEAELGELKSIANENLTTIKSGDTSAPKVFWFAEDVVVRLALKGIVFEHLFSQPSSVREFPISLPYFRALLDRVDGPAANSTAHGDVLELLAAYLFLLIPGWFPSRNILDENQGFETDLIITNLNPTSNLAAELFGRNLLVECKNWAQPVSVKDVGYFLYRMRLAHCNFGVMFATHDITGETQGETAARSLIRRAYHEDGITCIVLNRNDLESLALGEISFWTLLLREMQRFRFGKPR